MSDDNTDTILGGVTAGFLAFCAICVAVNTWRSHRQTGMKPSRSETDLTLVVADDPA